MAEMTIGGASYALRQPRDLDADLLASTGCDAAEAAKHLAGWPSPNRIASALRPFLSDDAPCIPALAQEIADADDGPEVLIGVKQLYADRTEPVTAAAEEE